MPRKKSARKRTTARSKARRGSSYARHERAEMARIGRLEKRVDNHEKRIEKCESALGMRAHKLRLIAGGRK